MGFNSFQRTNLRPLFGLQRVSYAPFCPLILLDHTTNKIDIFTVINQAICWVDRIRQIS